MSGSTRTTDPMGNKGMAGTSMGGRVIGFSKNIGRGWADEVMVNTKEKAPSSTLKFGGHFGAIRFLCCRSAQT